MKSSSCIYLVPHSAVFNAHEVPEFDTFGKDNSSNLYSALILNHKENFIPLEKNYQIIYGFDEADKDFIPSDFNDATRLFFCNTKDRKSAFKLLADKYFNSFSNNILVFASSIGFAGNEIEKTFNLLSMDDEALVIGKCINNEIAFIGFNTFNGEVFNAVKCIDNNFDDFLAVANKQENFIHTMGNFLFIKEIDDFKKLYAELSKKESWSYCNQNMHEQFTHLFIEYKDLLK